MPRLGRRPLVLALVLAAAAAVSYELWPRDETKIVDLLSELCVKLNQTRDDASLAALRDALRDRLLSRISVHAPELEPGLEGRGNVLHAAGELLAGPPLSFALSATEVHLSGPLARVEADLSVNVRGSGEQRRELRHAQVRLAKQGANWQIEALEISAVPAAQPEARP